MSDETTQNDRPPLEVVSLRDVQPKPPKARATEFPKKRQWSAREDEEGDVDLPVQKASSLGKKPFGSKGFGGKGFGSKSGFSRERDQKPQGPRPPKPPVPERLWRIALYNIEQRETSTAGLRRILTNRARRYAMTLAGEERHAVEEKAALDIEDVVARAVKEGLINDARFAEMKARGWRNRGWGERRIAMEMRARGMDQDVAQDALTRVDEETIEGLDGDQELQTEEADFVAADVLCKRRKIGPYRKTAPATREERNKVWRREMGILARAGFGGKIVQTLLEMPEISSSD